MKETLKRLLIIIALPLLIISLIALCLWIRNGGLTQNPKTDVKKDTGDPYLIAGVLAEDDEAFYLSADDDALSVMSVSGGSKVLHRLPMLAQYSENLKSYVYISDGGLFSYSPSQDKEERLFDIDSDGAVIAAGENYVLVSENNTTKKVISLKDGTVFESEVLYKGSLKIYDIRGDTLLLWDDATRSLCLYDLAGDFLTSIYTQKNPLALLFTAAFCGDSVYFALSDSTLNDDTPLQELKNIHGGLSSPVPVADTAHIIGVCEKDGNVFFASREGNIVSFYVLNGISTIKLGENEWKRASYAIKGSFELSVSDSLLVAAFNHIEGVFTLKLN